MIKPYFIKLTNANGFPSHWQVGDKIESSLIGGYRIIKIIDNNTIFIRKWRWFDYLAIVFYAIKLTWIDICNYFKKLGEMR